MQLHVAITLHYSNNKISNHTGVWTITLISKDTRSVECKFFFFFRKNCSIALVYRPKKSSQRKMILSILGQKETPRQNVTNKCSQNHNQLNNYSNKPYKFTRACIACIIQSTKLMHIDHNKEERCPICMQISQKPSIGYITHQMLYTVKCLIYMGGIVHSLKDSCQNLLNQTLTSLNSPIIISIQIRRSRITNLMILDHCLYWLVKQTTTQFFHFSSHR
jgi:hypothetical protein